MRPLRMPTLLKDPRRMRFSKRNSFGHPVDNAELKADKPKLLVAGILRFSSWNLPAAARLFLWMSGWAALSPDAK
jgi:hypothetical protein